MPVKLNSSGGGSVTLDVPSTASDFTATIPANSGTVVTTGSTATVTPAMLSTGAPSWDSSGNLSFNSGYGSVATAFGCRAWVNFNGTGTVAIRASGNVSSITDNGVGDYTVNLSNALPDTNAFLVSQGRSPGVANGVGQADFSSSSAVFVGTFNTSNARADFTLVTLAIVR
jgi:hypothetical protein